MAADHVPDEFFEAVAHHVPSDLPIEPKGGRPQIAHRTAPPGDLVRLDRRHPTGGRPGGVGRSGRTAHQAA